jgi:hypothetical protein
MNRHEKRQKIIKALENARQNLQCDLEKANFQYFLSVANRSSNSRLVGCETIFFFSVLFLLRQMIPKIFKRIKIQDIESIVTDQNLSTMTIDQLKAEIETRHQF